MIIVADYCRLSIGSFELQNKDLTLDEIVEIWKEKGCPIWGSINEMGFSVRNGEFWMDDSSHDLIEQWDEWDHIVDSSEGLYGNRVSDFIQDLMQEDEVVKVVVECENDSTDVESTFWLDVTKRSVELTDEGWYNPDEDDDDDDDDDW